MASLITEAARVALMSISTYVQPKESPFAMYELDSPWVKEMRERYNGALAPPPVTRTRWYQADLELAERLADQGDLRLAGQLMHATRKDGHLAGILSTRTGGLVRLPRRFRGDADVISKLELGNESTRSAFDEMFPPSELGLLAADGLILGVGVAELLPVRGRPHPVMVRLDPQYLRYYWQENTWYYNSMYGMLPIKPGDGNWILHTPGGRIAPWQSALYRALGQAWIRKQHASLHKDNWEAKLANPARVAYAPHGAGEEQKQSIFQQVMAWGVNSVFGLMPGYEVKLIESNGIGWESFNETIKQSNEEFVLAIAGQLPTVTGGTGFANMDVHKSIRADLIKETADGLGYTINTQGLPTFVRSHYGADAVLKRPVTVEWNVTPPKDRNSEGTAMQGLAQGITQLRDALRSAKIEPDVRQLVDAFAVPVRPTLEAAATGGGGGGDIQDTALNGAQIGSLLEVVQAAAGNLIPRDSAQAIIERAFQVNEAAADKLLGSVGKGFVPASEPGAPSSAPTPPNGTPPNGAPSNGAAPISDGATA